jgi:hypothetical protein
MPVAGLPVARSLAAGADFTCAATADERAYCWGHGEAGQLGDGGSVDRVTPRPVSGLTGVRRVFAGIHGACAIVESGAVSCWGERMNSVPRAVSGLPAAAVDVAVLSSLACAALADGAVWCWAGDVQASRTELTGAVGVALGRDGPCAIVEGGSLRCGALPAELDPYPGREEPTVELPAPAVALSGSSLQMCALLTDGGVSCWGDDLFGDPDMTDGEPFGPDVFASRATAVSVGFGFACVVLESGDVQCWGDNWAGQLGDGTDRGRPTPVAVSGLPVPAREVTAARGLLVSGGGCGDPLIPDDHAGPWR